MSDPFDSDDLPQGEVRLSAIEQLLQDAAGLIEVSPDLRSRTIDGARCAAHDRRVRRRFLLATLVWIALSGAMGSHDPSATPRFGHVSLDSIVTSQDVFVLADARSTARRADLSWALVDVFQELRERRADLIGQTSE